MTAYSRALRLPFLGTRSYLHGTTLFAAIHDELEDARDLVFSLRAPIFSDQVELRPGDWGGSASFACRLGSGELNLVVVPLAPSAAPVRVAWDEEAITRRAEVDPVERALAWPGDPATAFVPALVALHKHLLRATVHPAGPGQWLFARLEAPVIPSSAPAGELVVREVLAGGRLVRSSFLGRSGARADIHFAWHDPGPGA